MARAVIWSPASLSDIDAIGAYIERDSVVYARRVIQRIFQAAEGASSMPRLARVVPELNDDAVREVFVHSYRLVYRIAGDSIEVAAVIHQSRLFENAVGSRAI